MAIVVRNDNNKLTIGNVSGGIPSLGDNAITLGNEINPIQSTGGDGTVKSVNGILPDEDGNVTISTSGTSDHNQLNNRSLANQHPTSAITGLDTELDKIDVVYPLSQTFNGSTIPFTNTDLVLNDYQVTSNLVITPNTSGVINNGSTSINFIGDGTHTLDLTAFIDIDEASTTFDNINNTYNPVVFIYSLGKYYRKHLPTYVQVIDTTAPVFQSASVSNSVKNRIVLVYNETLDSGSIPATTDFIVSGGKTISSINVSGSSVYINVNSNYAYGDSITFTYTAGSNPIQDVAGNNAANKSTTSVTNNISAPDVTAPVLQTATVESANPNKIILTYNETLDNTSVPSTTDYTPSGSKTVTNVSISGAVVTLTVNSNYTSSDTITVSYTSGSNPIRDMALNIVVNLVGQSVTNNVSAPTAPTLSSAATSIDGLTVTLTFSKAMGASPSSTGITFSPSKTISSITRQSGDTTKYDVVVSVAFSNSDSITVSYTPGTIVASDGGVLAGFSGVSVTNNVVAGGNYYRLDSYGTEFFVYDAKDTANFTLSGSDINVIKDGSSANNNASYSSNNKFIYNSLSKTFSSGAQAAVYTPPANISIGNVHSIVLVANISSLYNGSFIGSNIGGYMQFNTSSNGSWLVYRPNATNSSNQCIWNISAYLNDKNVFIITRNAGQPELRINGTLISVLGGTVNSESAIINQFGSANQLAEYYRHNVFYLSVINSVLSNGDITTISNALLARY